jgi:hypothetical protein
MTIDTLVPKQLWQAIQPLLPPPHAAAAAGPRRRPRGARRDRLLAPDRRPLAAAAQADHHPLARHAPAPSSRRISAQSSTDNTSLPPRLDSSQGVGRVNFRSPSRVSSHAPSTPCPRRFRFAMAYRVEWTVSGQIDRTGGVRTPVRSWRPWWTPDTTTRTSDRDQTCGRSGIEHGCKWSRRTGPNAGSGWGWPKGAWAVPCCPVRPGRAGRVVGRGQLARRMVGRWALEVSTAWPPPSGPGPDPSARRSHRTGDVRPTGRSSGPPCPSPDQPLPGVRRRN